MDETQSTTPVETQQPVTAPPPEQAPTTAVADPAVDVASLQRAYTQTSQKLAAVAAALGIPKTSTSDQFVAAITTRRQADAAADAAIQTDPRLAAQAAALAAREERLVRTQYGATADLALSLRDAVAGGGSLVDIVQLVDEAMADRMASRSSAAAPVAAPAAPQAAAPSAPAPVERSLMAEPPRGNTGMVDPGITPDREAGPEGFFKSLAQKVPALLR